jgi:hypothetical protein
MASIVVIADVPTLSIAVPGLTRPAMAAAIMDDAAIAVRSQEEHLVLEGVCAERPAMAEYDGLARAPIIEIDLRSILLITPFESTTAYAFGGHAETMGIVSSGCEFEMIATT